MNLEKGLKTTTEELVTHFERLFYTLETKYVLLVMPSIK